MIVVLPPHPANAAAAKAAHSKPIVRICILPMFDFPRRAPRFARRTRAKTAIREAPFNSPECLPA